MEKKKKEKIQFSEIDITTASEDEIIKSGLRDNVKSDKICYAIMSVIVILMLLPPALRFFVPKPITQVERDVLYVDLTCYRATVRDENELNTTLKAKYRDGDVSVVTIEHAFKDLPEGFTFVEINELLGIRQNLDGFKVQKEDNKYIFTIDFSANREELTKEEVLKKYASIYGIEYSYLTGENENYFCTPVTETVKEWVYIDTGEKVK